MTTHFGYYNGFDKQESKTDTKYACQSCG